MTTDFSMPNIPDKMSDSEARSLLEKYSPQVQKLSEEIVRNNTRAEQGQKAHEALMNKANAHFGVDDGSGNKVVPGGEEGMQRLLDQRMMDNAKNVREFFAKLDAAQKKVEAINKVAPSR